MGIDVKKFSLEKEKFDKEYGNSSKFIATVPVNLTINKECSIKGKNEQKISKIKEKRKGKEAKKQKIHETSTQQIKSKRNCLFLIISRKHTAEPHCATNFALRSVPSPVEHLAVVPNLQAHDTQGVVSFLATDTQNSPRLITFIRQIAAVHD